MCVHVCVCVCVNELVCTHPTYMRGCACIAALVLVHMHIMYLRVCMFLRLSDHGMLVM